MSYERSTIYREVSVEYLNQTRRLLIFTMIINVFARLCWLMFAISPHQERNGRDCLRLNYYIQPVQQLISSEFVIYAEN